MRIMLICGKKFAAYGHKKKPKQMLMCTPVFSEQSLPGKREIASHRSAIFSTLSNWCTTPAALQEERDSSVCETHSALKNKCFSSLSVHSRIHNDSFFKQAIVSLEKYRVSDAWTFKALTPCDDYQYIVIKLTVIIIYWVDGLVHEALSGNPLDFSPGLIWQYLCLSEYSLIQ